MVHWTDYSLRGWLSFLSFVHIGTAFRCFYDKNFLRDKIFTTNAAKDSAFHHLYGIYNIIISLILVQSSIYLYIMPIQKLAIWSMLLNVLYFLIEALYYKSILSYGSSLFPFLMSAITLLWIVTFHYIWKPWKRRDLELENELLLRGIASQKFSRKKR